MDEWEYMDSMSFLEYNELYGLWFEFDESERCMYVVELESMESTWCGIIVECIRWAYLFIRVDIDYVLQIGIWFLYSDWEKNS